jgi:hypothetical protein
LFADSIDHLPPRSVRSTLQQQGVAGRYKFLEVDCCRECNCLAGAEPPWDLPGRKKMLKKKLKKRYAKYLNMPRWDEKELSELGRNLRIKVEQGLLLKGLIEQRLKW